MLGRTPRVAGLPPQVRGAHHTFACRDRVHPRGLPPQVRGARIWSTYSSASPTGLTPAGAGSTEPTTELDRSAGLPPQVRGAHHRRWSSRAMPRRAYPRRCGEHRLHRRRRTDRQTGLPPQVRGAHPVLAASSATLRPRAYPRRCGEHVGITGDVAEGRVRRGLTPAGAGSTRGDPETGSQLLRRRLTPAGAGSTD